MHCTILCDMHEVSHFGRRFALITLKNILKGVKRNEKTRLNLKFNHKARVYMDFDSKYGKQMKDHWIFHKPVANLSR